MKKFLAIAAIAIAFTACNDEKKTDTVTTKDTTVVPVTPTATAPDSTVKVVTDSTVKTTVAKDTLKK